MSTITQHGYLALSDISGYTSYLAGVELDHAHEILTDLLEVIVGKFKSLLTIAKLEGDAVFAYAPESKVTRGETLLELVESTYAAFHDRITSSRRHTTCQCRACQNMPSLDLKFFIHHGDYIVQDVMGIYELVGSDVNLIHRLLKNHVTENTGWKAYALLTERALDHIGVRPTNMLEQVETYEHLGDTSTFSYDLKQRYQETVQSRRVFVEAEEAIVTLVKEIPAPVTVIWDWLNDPRKRAQYTAQSGLEFRPVHLPNGRRGVGAQTHCMHGENAAMKEVVLDWKPFDYFTVDQDGRPMFGDVICTFRLEPIQNGSATRLTLYIKGTILPGFLNKPLLKLIYGRLFMPMMLNNLAARIAEEQTAALNTIPDADSPQTLASHSGQA
jgi:hypothetical protein